MKKILLEDERGGLIKFGLSNGSEQALEFIKSQDPNTIFTLGFEDDDMEIPVVQYITKPSHIRKILIYCTSLQTLILQEQLVKKEVSEAWMSALQECPPTLKILNLSYNFLHEEDILSLTQSLPKLKQSEALDLSYGHLDHKNLPALALALQKCPNLKELDLSHTQITDLAFINALPQYQNLERLFLSIDQSHNQALRLAEILPQCRNLKELSLPDSYLEQQGAEALALALPQCPNLKKLALSGATLSCNPLFAQEFIALIRALPNYKNLKELHLPQNELNTEALNALTEILPHCKKLGLITLDYDNLEQRDALKNLVKASSTHPSLCLKIENAPEELELRLEEIRANKTMLTMMADEYRKRKEAGTTKGRYNHETLPPELWDRIRNFLPDLEELDPEQVVLGELDPKKIYPETFLHIKPADKKAAAQSCAKIPAAETPINTLTQEQASAAGDPGISPTQPTQRQGLLKYDTTDLPFK